ncbi:ABC transporter ATP-binding protein [Clostridium beijerinckii]|uniref:ABC transporter ATP-binding protein n=1 Tax=Clostridium beijerinckii TaxID=1520 RepID=UPI001361DB3F|nr:ABC transporter ATP-binding protein [Clostridium beijerinckii]MZK53459.1 ATP-binding cassette domain-containing protein [Clostridium beijerinckii]MZK61597.1 ATP-binding cassette domain-containing protein [Clostridium beijerinckii]MZK71883.1 ATP-binding cassette domain-containing protein [Clostridium beijerinckii]MZK77226.1 ATP-binding cassette domain-containing protein [Clostridium beijerinckii]MZK86854.1 ATP-binding cassette domain-containing protein [Clostridium beijerinckii]
MEVIKVDNVSKHFKIYYDKGSTLKEKILFTNRNRHEVHQVLKGINLSIKKGEVVGLIGKNGSGKSTLLKLMTKIIYPDIGEIKIKGKVSSLLELGAGFHPDMTGRENIYTNASIFGLTKKEIDSRLQKIIDFSELGEFIDNPVRTYSSGMYMRLAFSVAINVDAEILLIDEILAVGDTNFQQKCFERLRELKQKGITIVIVTHDTGTVEKFCSSAVWLENGVIKEEGKTHKVIDKYLKYMNTKRVESIELANKKEKEENSVNKDVINERENVNKDKEIALENEVKEDEIDFNSNRFGLRYVEITKALIRNSKGEETTVLRGGESADIEIYYKVNKPLEEYVFGMGFYTLEGLCLYGSNTQLDDIKVSHTRDKGVVKYHIDSIPLLTGIYGLNVAVVDENGTPMDFIRNYFNFNVVSDERSTGMITVNHQWII